MKYGQPNRNIAQKTEKRQFKEEIQTASTFLKNSISLITRALQLNNIKLDSSGWQKQKQKSTVGETRKKGLIIYCWWEYKLIESLWKCLA